MRIVNILTYADCIHDVSVEVGINVQTAGRSSAMDARDVEAAQVVNVTCAGATTRQTTHLRLDALVHAATVVHTLAVGGLSQAQLTGAQTLVEVTTLDAAVSVTWFVVDFRV